MREDGKIWNGSYPALPTFVPIPLFQQGGTGSAHASLSFKKPFKPLVFFMEKYNLNLQTLQSAHFCNARVHKWLAVVFLTPLALFPKKTPLKKPTLTLSLVIWTRTWMSRRDKSLRDETFQDGRTGQSFSENKNFILCNVSIKLKE